MIDFSVGCVELNLAPILLNRWLWAKSSVSVFLSENGAAYPDLTPVVRIKDR